MPSEVLFRRAAILGTGLIGGSFALALRRHFPETQIVGWDRTEVLHEAAARGAIQECASDLRAALQGADLVYIALPVSAAINLLPEIAGKSDSGALVTDACSTKVRLCRLASEYFYEAAQGSPALSESSKPVTWAKTLPATAAYFLGGHPIAGKEISGIESADPDLFRGSRYVLIRDGPGADRENGGDISKGGEGGRDGGTGSEGSQQLAGPAAVFVGVLRSIGAEPLWCDAERHDWAVGVVSHVPQLAAIALSRLVLDELDETGMPIALAGPGLRDMLRLAGSPYAIWRDVCLSNRENISRTLDRLSLVIEDIRAGLASRELETEFQAANDLYKILHDLQ